jgi:hypothetical protein
MAQLGKNLKPHCRCIIAGMQSGRFQRRPLAALRAVVVSVGAATANEQGEFC